MEGKGGRFSGQRQTAKLILIPNVHITHRLLVSLSSIDTAACWERGGNGKVRTIWCVCVCVLFSKSSAFQGSLVTQRRKGGGLRMWNAIDLCPSTMLLGGARLPCGNSNFRQVCKTTARARGIRARSTFSCAPQNPVGRPNSCHTHTHTCMAILTPLGALG